MITVRKSVSMGAARALAIGVDAGKPLRRSVGLLAAVSLAALVLAVSGCTDPGAGTVDIATAKDAAKTNPDMAKAAALRGAAGIGDAEKGGKKGRK